MIKELVSKIDWGLAGLWALVVFFFLLLVYLCLCFYCAGKEQEKVELLREIREALAWADPAKIIMDAEYAPVLISERRKT